jgi:cytochrome P450
MSAVSNKREEQASAKVLAPAVKRSPPGPGNSFFLRTAFALKRDPLGFFETCARDYGDIVKLRLLHIPSCFLNRPDLIEQVLVAPENEFWKSVDLQKSKPFLGEGLLTNEGESWRKQRKLLQPGFHQERVRFYGRVVNEFAVRMLDGWRAGETRDVHRDAMGLTLEIAARTFFDAGMESEAADVVRDSLLILMRRFDDRASTGFLIPPWLPTRGNRNARRAAVKLDGLIYKILREHREREEKGNDLLSMLAGAREEDGRAMSDKQIRDELITLLVAGHETTALNLSWTWYLLARNPPVEERLRAELGGVLGGKLVEFEDLKNLTYTEKVIKESLRLYPPAWMTGRQTKRDLELAGYHVPRGTNIYMSQWVTHRDARYFPEPERFHPGRWTEEFQAKLPRFAYFPFGGGPRVCIGASFALMEATQVLAATLQRFRLKLRPDTTVEPWASITLRPKAGMPMEICER